MGKKQQGNGDAWEYCITYNLENELQKMGFVNSKIVKDFKLDRCKKAFNALPPVKRVELNNIAIKIIKSFLLKENICKYDLNTIFKLNLLSNTNHIDVSDIMLEIDATNRLGISCKHNSDYIKSNRITAGQDFADVWCGKKCNSLKNSLNRRYNIIFNKYKNMKWSNVPILEKECLYIDILRLIKYFLESINKIEDVKSKAEMISNFAKFYLGSNDYYKFSAFPKKRSKGACGQILGFNFSGNLNTDKILLPSVLEDVFIENKKPNEVSNTLIIYFNNDWVFEIRIKNKDDIVGSSVGLETKLLKKPAMYEKVLY